MFTLKRPQNVETPGVFGPSLYCDRFQNAFHQRIIPAMESAVRWATMTFSIRELLALGFVVALSFLTFRTFVDTSQQRARLTQLQVEVQTLEAELLFSGPISQIEDEFAPLHTSSERAVEHFPQLREKYSTIQPRGPGVMSVRSIPNFDSDRIQYRIIVPEGRSVWLKFGVHMVSTTTSSSRESDKEDDLLTASPFEHNGPFEIELSPGDHTLTVTTDEVDAGVLPVTVDWDDETLLQTDFVSTDVSGKGGPRISAKKQIDYPSNRQLPWLLTVDMDLRDPSTGNRPTQTHAFSIWLSDHSSEFTEFPKQ